MSVVPNPPVQATVTAKVSLGSEVETARFAHAIGDVLLAGDTLLLTGSLGAGKTFFARCLIQSRMAVTGFVEEVPSPSFTLVQTYDLGTATFWHVDLYRLTGPDDVFELGLDEAMEAAICLIEWPDRLGSMRPPHAVELVFTDCGDDRREVSISGPDIGATHRIFAAVTDFVRGQE